MTKDITITSLQKEINILKNRIDKIEIQIKNENNSKQNKIKKIKDPNAPIKNISSYLHFSKEFRSKYLKDNHENKPKEIVKKIAEEWNKIKDDPKKKKKYDDVAIKDKKRYDKEIDEYRKKQK